MGNKKQEWLIEISGRSNVIFFAVLFCAGLVTVVRFCAEIIWAFVKGLTQ